MILQYWFLDLYCNKITELWFPLAIDKETSTCFPWISFLSSETVNSQFICLNKKHWIVVKAWQNNYIMAKQFSWILQFLKRSCQLNLRSKKKIRKATLLSPLKYASKPGVNTPTGQGEANAVSSAWLVTYATYWINKKQYCTMYCTHP